MRSMLHGAELALRGSSLELFSYLAGRRLPHAPVHGCPKDRSLILHSRSLEDVVAGIGYGLLGSLRWIELLSVLIGKRSRHNPIRLVAMLRCEIAMPVQHLGRRLQLFRIASSVGRNLGRSRAFAADLLQMRLDLLPAWARCLEILLGVALDLRLAMLAFRPIALPCRIQRECRS